MKKLLIAIVLFGALAAITNPSEEKHKEAIRREFKQSDGGESEGSELGKQIGNFILNNTVHRRNHYIYSETVVRVLGEEKVVGYGFFGFVIINQDELSMDISN